jgi:hypothetical protein
MDDRKGEDAESRASHKDYFAFGVLPDRLENNAFSFFIPA